jgi:hypothetical protein
MFHLPIWKFHRRAVLTQLTYLFGTPQGIAAFGTELAGF